jgi:glycosyltransferase involved in cell wall biosynthesis
MATVRIYLLTYQRNHLLSRAFHSLLNQTFTDWVCELHNDEPSNSFPETFVKQMGDSRITIVNHPENLGATRTFNLVFKSVAEPFVCLLEDDNWWEPDFLSTMLNSIEQFPLVQVAWANMRFWQENPNNAWTDTGKNIWNDCESETPQLFNWGQMKQIMGALHSNGAMLIRSQSIEDYIVPEETPFEAMEAVRERTFPFPILFVPHVCANFAITQTTSRSNNRVVWAQMQTMLIASFCKHTPIETSEMKQFWSGMRSKVARSTNGLFFAALICTECRNLLHYATLGDWLFFIASCIKRPFLAFTIFQSVEKYPQIWEFLDQKTSDRVKEVKQIKI